MAKIVTFGEIMLRLAPPNLERPLQSVMFVATFGGGEANVAVSTAQYGLPTSYVTVLPPNNPIAYAWFLNPQFGADIPLASGTVDDPAGAASATSALDDLDPTLVGIVGRVVGSTAAFATVANV